MIELSMHFAKNKNILKFDPKPYHTSRTSVFPEVNHEFCFTSNISSRILVPLTLTSKIKGFSGTSQPEVHMLLRDFRVWILKGHRSTSATRCMLLSASSSLHPANNISLSHKTSTSQLAPASQQYFSLTKNQHQPAEHSLFLQY